MLQEGPVGLGSDMSRAELKEMLLPVCQLHFTHPASYLLAFLSFQSCQPGAWICDSAQSHSSYVTLGWSLSLSETRFPPVNRDTLATF